MDDLRKSLNAVLNERLTSPLFGSLIVSWLIWNWKIVLILFFVSESSIKLNKIDYIINYYSDFNTNITFPLISALLLITVVPLISNGSYWLSLIYQNWKSKKKYEVEQKQLLTLEQSISLRTEMRNIELELSKIIDKKEVEISLLKDNNDALLKRLEEKESFQENYKRTNRNGMGTSSYGTGDFNKFMENEKASSYLENIAKEIRNKGQFPENLPENIKEFYLVNDIVEEKYNASGAVFYELTLKGNGLYRDYFNSKF
jgi:hypothetical protein